jgi:hypothetical protein
LPSEAEKIPTRPRGRKEGGEKRGEKEEGKRREEERRKRWDRRTE